MRVSKLCGPWANTFTCCKRDGPVVRIWGEVYSFHPQHFISVSALDWYLKTCCLRHMREKRKMSDDSIEYKAANEPEPVGTASWGPHKGVGRGEKRLHPFSPSSLKGWVYVAAGHSWISQLNQVKLSWMLHCCSQRHHTAVHTHQNVHLTDEGKKFGGPTRTLFSLKGRGWWMLSKLSLSPFDLFNFHLSLVSPVAAAAATGQEGLGLIMVLVPVHP